jgi:hypothetical protein
MSDMISFLISFGATYIVGLWLIRRWKAKIAERNRALEEAEAKAFEAYKEAMVRHAKARLQLELIVAQQRMARDMTQYYAAYEAARGADRAANRNGSIDSTCYEVPKKKLLN